MLLIDLGENIVSLKGGFYGKEKTDRRRNEETIIRCSISVYVRNSVIWSCTTTIKDDRIINKLVHPLNRAFRRLISRRFYLSIIYYRSLLY